MNHIDISSVNQVLKGASKGLIYGFDHCEYTTIWGLIEHLPGFSPYDFRSLSDRKNVTHNALSERVFKIASHDVDQQLGLHRTCKAALTNLVLENYKNLLLNNGRIDPVIFCIDIDNNPYPFNEELLLSKTKSYMRCGQKALYNDLVTHSEIRRCYKLCFDYQIPYQVRQAALKTFKFVKVRKEINCLGSTTIYLDPIKAPWESSAFQKYLANRLKAKSFGAHTDFRHQVQKAAYQIKATLIAENKIKNSLFSRLLDLIRSILEKFSFFKFKNAFIGQSNVLPFT